MAKNKTLSKYDILAAGCVCWRVVDGELQVLVIHRPRYDDWSWPKGKQDDGETLPETAVRELREETGLHITLGVHLADTEYTVRGHDKLVRYWAAEVSPFAHTSPEDDEVDRMSWLPVARARSILTNEDDTAPLDELARLYARASLATRPVIVIRHAKAKPRSSWQRAEGDRPLAATGKRQALAVTRLLAAWQPKRVVTSPWLRCISTVVPYAKKYGIKVKERSQLTEAAHKRHPKRAAQVTEQLFDTERPVVLCTHRPVLPTVLKVLAKHLPPALAAQLPDADPYLSPGQMIVLHMPRASQSARAVGFEIISPFDD
ncbi:MULTISPECIES: NUDIX hydrolase [Kocuria]|uniref:8-oxo-dGTP diphosphatase n=1 Tax=Kocuria marina subsp. indica TaxID=1049583 RepID=A0A1X7E4J5_9MICC|nr:MULTISPECIES: NUDIX hydrolase [Kocuria]OBA51044.1 NUDIX hydrolase [Kocuria sp. ICS0012]OXS80714.1 NUDIX hydrolase [Kocuria indica]RLP56807.1 NUDIX hydrolase [Kocuria indica]SMF26640.1 8-oxo-dGTP diphosphatase [Kocuria indica]